MNDDADRLTVPDIALHRLGGGEIDPADFRGQKLVIFFCPDGQSAAKREIDQFRSLAPDFANAGAWVLGVLAGPVPPSPREGMSHITLAEDKDGHVWGSLEAALRRCGSADASKGAVLFFERGGTLRNAWLSSGHAFDALKAAYERG